MIEVIIKSPACDESIEFLDRICEKTLMQAGFEDWRSISFAVHEIIINGIEATKQKCNENSSDKVITLKIYAKEDEVEIHVEDEGDGMDKGRLDKVNEMDFEDVLGDESGRGLLMVKHFVDKIWCEIGAKHSVKIQKRRGRNNE